MRNKPKNIRMELEVTLDVETLSYMKFSLTLHSKIKKYWEREREIHSQLCQIYSQLSVDFKITSEHLSNWTKSNWRPSFKNLLQKVKMTSMTNTTTTKNNPNNKHPFPPGKKKKKKWEVNNIKNPKIIKSSEKFWEVD